MTLLIQNGLFDENKDEAPPISFSESLLALSKVRGLGIKGIFRIVDKYRDNLGEIFSHNGETLFHELASLEVSGAKGIAVSIFKEKDELIETAKKEVKSLHARNITILSPRQLPNRITLYPDSPLWLFVEGNVNALSTRPTVGVVGSRQPTDSGRLFARRVAKSLSMYDAVVVSGLAEGIDDEIHRFSMSYNLKNVAFLGHGINRVFPQATSDTRSQIIAGGGAVVTEYFPDDTYQRSQFVARNRLQAMLSEAVVFVEAKQKSGTLHTYNFSKRYKRHVIGIKSNWDALDKIIEKDGYPVFDLNKKSGMKLLDREFRRLSEAIGRKNSIVDKLEKQIFEEISIRDIKSSDIKDLHARFISMTANLLSGEEK
ncbi:DNA-processing protein DprA [Deinococcus xianganensis]|uniref:Smf/DprA SLOG domain-containing protein n=1 Tax=Deinococcus xianganensis TaxID=1507289 RepID=A0A6I4YH50_9DEIO|nr:hypothetical protein [Deinococcus xianganensis]